jgi:hypothetical protein
MVSMRAVLQEAVGTVVTLLVLLALPEPVTKFVAAWATAALVLWVGAFTLYNLVKGWFELMEEVKVATTFEEIREAGEKVGRLFSREAAQAFAMIVMALLTHTAKGFAEQVATLPGSAQVSLHAAEQEGVLLSEVGAVESVGVTDDGFSMVLAPGAVAMAASGGRRNRVEDHHMGTIANEISTLRGGPWTPRFKRLFARAGMRLTDEENIVPIKGHKGPHPQLTDALKKLAREISTPGTELNRLLTLGK